MDAKPQRTRWRTGAALRYGGRASCLLLLVGFAVGLSAQAPAGPPSDPGEIRGLLVMRGDQVLVEDRADLRLTPASVHKLLVSAAALHYLGPDYRFRSRVEAARVDGVVASGLRLVGGGDPTWQEEFYEDDSTRPLRELAEQIFAAGVRRVQGDLVVDAAAVRGRRVPVDWGVADATLGYGAAPSALALDRNRTTIRIGPGGQVGRPARILEAGGLSWVNRSVTVEAERHGRGTIAFDLEADQAVATLRGEYPISERPIQVDIATPDADSRVGWAFARALRERGIAFEGDVRVELSELDGDATARRELAVFESVPLREILVPLLADSDNFTAEMLLRHVGLRVRGAGRLDIGLDAMETFLVEVVGWTEDQFELDDGSGLSPFNLLAPRAVVRLLRWSWEQPWRAVYFDAMASPTRGTVADFWPAAPPLRAKSGTIRQTQGLAGVLLPGTGNGRVPVLGEASPEPVFFVWMVNHATRSRSEIRREVMSTLQSWQRTLF